MRSTWAALLFTALILGLEAQDAKPPETKTQEKGKEQQPPPPKGGTGLRTFKSKPLLPDPGDRGFFDTQTISEIGHIAMVVKTKDGKHRVLVDTPDGKGKEHKPYTFIIPVDTSAATARPGAGQPPAPGQPVPRNSSRNLSGLLRWAPDNVKIYYTAYTGRNYVIASEGYESKPYDYIMEGMPIFSPDAKKIAFAAGRAGKWYIVLNDVESSPYDDLQLGTLVFSPDSKRLAFCARKSSEWRVFYEGSSYPALEGVAENNPIFSPDSKRVAYIAFSRQNKQVIMIDGQRLGEYDAVGEGTLRFSPDSKRLIYSQKNKGRWYVHLWDMTKGKEEVFGPYDEVGERMPIVSPDSKRVAWAAKNGGIWYVYDNGKEVTEPSPRGDKKPVAIAANMILRGTPIFSNDSKRLAFGLARNGGWAMWCDGVESPKFDEIKDDTVIFSTDNTKLAFIGMKQKMYVPVVEFKELKPAYDVTPVRISRGERTGTVAIGVKRKRTPEELAEAKKAKKPQDPDPKEDYWILTVDGEDRYGPYNEIQGSALSVSRDGKRVAVPAEDKEGWHISIEGEHATEGLPLWIRFHPENHFFEMIATVKEGYALLYEVQE